MIKEDGGNKTQLISSLPYHISEPFFHKLVKLSSRIEDVVLVVGEKLLNEITTTSEDSVNFGAVSLMAQSFFHINCVANINKNCFYPVPRTDSGIVRLLPKNPSESRDNRRDYIFRKFYLTEDKNHTLVSVLKDALVEYEQTGQMGTSNKKEFARKNRRLSNIALRTMISEYNYIRFTTNNSDTLNPYANLLTSQHQALNRK